MNDGLAAFARIDGSILAAALYVLAVVTSTSSQLVKLQRVPSMPPASG